MIEIKSYIKIPEVKIITLEEVIKAPEKHFIEISQTTELKKILKKIDLDYLEGVIFFKYRDQVIFDYNQWDLIDQLWAYILNSIEEIQEKKGSEFYFPDQPLKVKFEINRDRLKIEIAEKVYSIPKDETIKELLKSMKCFFVQLSKFSKFSGRYTDEINRITKLEEKF